MQELDKFKLDKVIEWQERIASCHKEIDKIYRKLSDDNIDKINKSLERIDK